MKATLSTAAVWPTWIAVRIGSPRPCATDRKWAACSWFFSTDGLEWLPFSRGFPQARMEQASVVRHLERQECNRQGCRVVDLYVGPFGH